LAATTFYYNNRIQNYSVKLAESVAFIINTVELIRLLDKIVALAEKNNVVDVTFFLTCWQILLWRLTGKGVIGNLQW